MIHVKLIGNAYCTMGAQLMWLSVTEPCSCFSGTEFGSGKVKENGGVFTVKGKNIHSNAC